MKYLAILTLTVPLCLGADFTTGQAARLVIGQPTFTAQEDGVSSTLLGAVGGLAYANNMLVVVDSNRLGATPINNRVLIYKNLSQQLPKPEADIPDNAGRCPVCVGEADVVLGQPDFDIGDLASTADNTMRTPLAAATDGVSLAVADTDNNRVLIWHSIPAVNQQPADVVLGQPDFTRAIPNDGGGFTPNERTFKGPQGVWIQNGRLFVADTGNNRVLIWNQIPNSNYTPADVVLGQPDFRTYVQPDITQTTINAQPTTMLTPVSVTTDGQHLFVADLGHNRVLIWNSIPTRNQQPADVAVGQPDLVSAVPNNSSALCEAIGEDADTGDPVYPGRCGKTLEFPRFALAGGGYLFIADGGNDRILVYNSIPTQDGAEADAVLGQIEHRVNLISDQAEPRGVASSGAVRTPLGLAWDGTNLFASDPFNRRVMVFTPGEHLVPNTGVRNGASIFVHAVGAVSLAQTPTKDDTVTVTVSDTDYEYTAQDGDTVDDAVNTLTDLINAGDGDPNVLATANLTLGLIVLTARDAGEAGNNVTLAAATSDNATILVSVSGTNLEGGSDAAQIAPGTVVKILGDNLSETTASVPESTAQLPTELAGVRVYIDGIRAPLFMVSPTEIRAQVPWEVMDGESSNAYVREARSDGSVLVSTAVSVPITPYNPGIFAVEGGDDPRPVIAFHSSSHATGTVSVDGQAQAGAKATVTIEDRNYTYIAVEGDTLASIRDHLVDLINTDPKVEASRTPLFARIRLRARAEGPAGNGIIYSAAATQADALVLSATTPALCCANVAGAPVTLDNPALPGETILVLATGLGVVKPDDAQALVKSGALYTGSAFNDPVQFVNSLAGARTANVLSAGLKPGTIGVYEVALELNSEIPTNPVTQLTIAQSVYVSNVVSIPVFNPESFFVP